VNDACPDRDCHTTQHEDEGKIMNRTHRVLWRIIASTLGMAATQLLAVPHADACCTPGQKVPVYVHGTFAGVNAGDMVGLPVATSTPIGPIIAAIAVEYPKVEIYEHVFHIDDAGGRWLSEDIADPEHQVTQGWDCTHPMDPYDMNTMRPGVLYNAPTDGLMDEYLSNTHEYETQSQQYTPWGMVVSGDDSDLSVMGPPGKTGYTDVVKGVGVAACTQTALYDGYESPGGYHLYAFTHAAAAGTNGMCVDYMTNFCGVKRPTPLTYAASYAYNATVAIYNHVWNNCNAGISWLDSTLCSGACDRAANQFVNTFWLNDPWNTGWTWSGGEPAVTGVVTPGNLMTVGGTATGARAPVPITSTAGYWTTTTETVCTPGMCP
jgi:hypothetical protein